MINNDYNNPLNRFFTNRNNANKTGSAADVYKKLKERQDSIKGKTDETKDQAKTEDSKKTSGKTTDTTTQSKADKYAGMTSEERRQAELKEILDRIEAEEAQRRGNRANAKNDKKTDKSSDTAKSGTTDSSAQANSNVTTVTGNTGLNTEVDEYGFPQFLNDMPLFNQFKEDLVKAFKSMDGATYGSISAQFEVNYKAVQTIANEAGGYDVTETVYNFKLDLNYVKAASGKGSNASLSDLFGTSQKNPTANDLMNGIKDYWSSENTADRIVDFATAFFPNSAQFKAGGDTEESRSEFAEVMRKAVQKGFDQAMGKLGKVPKSVQDTIDKTHELTFKGFDDFVKYGMNRNKPAEKTDDFYGMLQAFSMNMTQSYSKTSYSYTPGQTTTTSATANPTDQSTIDAQA